MEMNYFIMKMNYFAMKMNYNEKNYFATKELFTYLQLHDKISFFRDKDHVSNFIFVFYLI